MLVQRWREVQSLEWERGVAGMECVGKPYSMEYGNELAWRVEMVI